MRVLLSLGSNLGDRRRHLQSAIRFLDGLNETRIVRVSHGYETEPWGLADQPAFLNAAAEIETALEPLELLNAVKVFERAMGREPALRWGPRVIDIDIVLWGDQRLDSHELNLPHPEFRNRAFVLVPLTEIAADAVDPVTGKTVAELAQQPESQGRVELRDRLDH